MVVAAFPLLKLASLIINQISTPLANKAKAKAKTSPFFRKYICIPPAQAYHWCEVRMSMWSKKISGKQVKIPPLKESTAIELGAGLVGDATIFIVGSSIFLLEYLRRSRNNSIKDMQAEQQHALILQDVKTLYIERAKQEEKIKELCRILDEYMGGMDFNPAPISEDALPEHHREPEVVEEETGLYKTFEWFFTILNYLSNYM